jgi:hypothetical protein
MKYFQRKRKEKLYRQWVEQAGLPPEIIHPETNKAEDIHPQAGKTAPTYQKISDYRREEILNKLHPYLLYILLGVSLLVLCAGLILVIMHAC